MVHTKPRTLGGGNVTVSVICGGEISAAKENMQEPSAKPEHDACKTCETTNQHRYNPASKHEIETTREPVIYRKIRNCSDIQNQTQQSNGKTRTTPRPKHPLLQRLDYRK